MKRCIAMFVLLAGAIGLSAQSPWNTTTFPAVVVTGSGQTSAPVILQRGSGARDSYSAGKISLTGVGLSTATFSVLGSADNGATYNPLAIETCEVPGTFATSETATATPSCYEVNTSGLYAVKFTTSGTFTATSVSLVLTVSPNAQITRNGGGGGGGSGCSGGLSENVSFSGQIGTFSEGCLTAVGSPFEVTISCSAAGSVETGDASANPNDCTFGYSNGTPASGTLGDGTNTVTLTTPYTSGALDYAYSTNTTFTVQATATNSQTASASDSRTFTSRTFGGIGDSGGATGATASGTTAVLVGDTGTLTSAGLGDQGSYGPYTPSNQYIYVLMLSGSCTFTSGGFNFPVNTPTEFTFTNQYAANVTMYLYQSTNSLDATFTLVPTC